MAFLLINRIRRRGECSTVEKPTIPVSGLWNGTAAG